MKHKNIDPVKWDQCISKSLSENIYGYHWYLNAVADYQWDAIVMDDYNAVFPLPVRKKFGLPYIYQPFFCQQLGVYGNDINLVQNDFLNCIPPKFKKIHLQLNSIFKLDTKSKLRPNYILDLHDSYELIRKGYKQDALKNLKKCARSEIVYSIDAMPEEVIGLHRNVWGLLDQKLSDHDYKRFAQACNAASEHGRYYGIKATLMGETIGAAIFLRSETRLHYMVSGPTETGRKHSVMHGIMDFAIRTFSNQNLILDFEGSSIPEVALFYEKWGSKKTEYHQVKISILELIKSLYHRLTKG